MTTITSPDNEKLKLLRRLTDGRGRRKEGLFAGEGEDLLDAALAAGAEPEWVLVPAGLGAVPELSGVEPIEVDAELFQRASAMGSGSRVIAVWAVPDAPVPGEAVLRVFLDGVSDPGNVGAIVRSADALLGARVVLGPDSADAYSPKAVRASMGSIFSQPPLRGEVGSTPAPRLGLTAHEGESLDEAIGSVGPRTVCLGAEREGLSAEVADACEAMATIPLAGSAESLNVAATAAIVLQRISSIAPGAPDAPHGPGGPGGPETESGDD